MRQTPIQNDIEKPTPTRSCTTDLQSQSQVLKVATYFAFLKHAAIQTFKTDSIKNIKKNHLQIFLNN